MQYFIACTVIIFLSPSTPYNIDNKNAKMDMGSLYYEGYRTGILCQYVNMTCIFWMSL